MFEGFDPEVVKLIISQGIFAVLFVWLLYDTRKEAKTREERNRSEAIAREDKLMAHLTRTTEAIEQLSNRVDTIAEIALKNK